MPIHRGHILSEAINGQKKQLLDRWKVEPGKSIRDRLVEFVKDLEPGPLSRSAEMFKMLVGLPYREEVPNGRDFQGIDMIGGRQLDFTDCDFSNSPNIWDMFACDLSRSKFDAARGDRGGFEGSILRECSFKRVKFRHMGFDRCDCRGACFDDAWLRAADFQNTDLRDASFQRAYLHGAVFVGANLIGCDFRGADLQAAVLWKVTVDATTDFRGANLTNAYLEDEYDKVGNLRGRGIDLKACTLDATTRLGNDPRIHALEVLHAALDVAAERHDTESQRVRQAIQRVLADLQSEYFDDWYDRVINRLNPGDLEAHSDIMNEAYRTLL